MKAHSGEGKGGSHREELIGKHLIQLSKEKKKREESCSEIKIQGESWGSTTFLGGKNKESCVKGAPPRKKATNVFRKKRA